MIISAACHVLYLKFYLVDVGNSETTELTSVVEEMLESVMYPAERKSVEIAPFAKFKQSILVPAMKRPQTAMILQ